MKNLKLFATPLLAVVFMLLTYFYPTATTSRNYYYSEPMNNYIYTPSYTTYQVDPYDVYAGQVIDNFSRTDHMNHIINYKYHTKKSPNFAYQSIWY